MSTAGDAARMLSSFRYQLRTPTAPLSVADWRARARRRVPRMVWAYIESGADDERTVRRNEEAFAEWWLQPRTLRGIGDIDAGLELLGTRLDMPVLIAPTGLAGAVHWHGDLGLARAAESAGTRLVLSSASGYSIEEVAAGTRENHWFQLYPWRSRDLMSSLMQRAEEAGYSTLVLTVDVPVYGRRLRELRTGMAIPPTISLGSVLDAVVRPSWTWHLLREQRMSLKNLAPRPGDADPLGSLAVQSKNLTADVNWDDLAWIRSNWRGGLLVKGILGPDDAERAVATGADGVVVSNHGGRQLNATSGSLDALPAVAERVGGQVPVLLDGGVRSGTDVVIARALGATAVLVGRAANYGLGGGGTAGAAAVMSLFKDELVRAMALMGVSTLDEIGPEAIQRARASIPHPVPDGTPPSS